MAGSPPVSDDLKYLYASNVNVSNFVSEKLSDGYNYPLWKAQMLCLMESHQMRGIVDNLFDDPGATYYKTIKQYDSLLKGWIFGSLTPDVLRDVVHLKSARDVWWQLQSLYDNRGRFEDDGGSTSKKVFTEIEPQDPSTDSIQIEIPTVTEQTSVDTTLRRKLLKATVDGRWWQAESILKNDKQAATEAITDDGNTMLHVAVARGRNNFVKHLLEFIDDGEQIEKKNSDGRTALHIAAIVGNTLAVELLLKKRKELLEIADNKAFVPLVSAYYNMKLDTFVDLLEAARIELPTDQRSAFFPDSAFKSEDKPQLVYSSIDGDTKCLADLSNIHRKLVKRCSLLLHSYGFLNAIAKDILWAKRESKNTLRD